MTALIVCAVFLRPDPSAAQMMHLDDLPWFAAPDSTSRLAFVAEVGHFEDRKWGWEANRIMVTAILPAGDFARFYLRGSHVSFNAGDTPLLTRWPWIRGEEAEEDWPGGNKQSSFGSPEIGVTGPLEFSFLDHWQYGVGLGLPVGSDRIYPFGSTSLPLRIDLRKVFFADGPTNVTLTGGKLMHMSSGKKLLSEEAFPSGYRLGAAVHRYWGPGRSLILSWDYQYRQGAESHLPAVQGWLPWTDNGAVGARLACELAGTLDRPAQWYVSLMWRFDSPKYRPGVTAEVE